MKAEGFIVLLYVIGIPLFAIIYSFITDEDERLELIANFWDMWEKVKKFFINACIVLAFISLVAAMAYIFIWDSPSNSGEYNEEQIEDIMDDPKWNIPSRYRD